MVLVMDIRWKLSSSDKINIFWQNNNILTSSRILFVYRSGSIESDLGWFLILRNIYK